MAPRGGSIAAFLLYAAPLCASPTFTRDVAPILYKHCASCHRSGDVAPFPLSTYRDAASRARLIAKVTALRYMPPWKPVHGYGDFAGERRLSPAEVDTLRRWADAGAPEGDPARLPRPPRIDAAWRLGRPDLVVKMPQRFEVPAEGADLYECFVIPLHLDRDRYVRAVDFRPANRKVVHHALLFIDAGAGDRPRGSYPCFGTPGFLPSGSLGGWSPGAGPVIAYPGTATRLPRGSQLVLQVHFHPSGRPETEQASIGLYFTDEKPRKAVVDIGLVSRNFDIPPGDSAYKVRDHFTIPVNVHAVGIIPHAHYLCKDMKGWAILPGGSRRPLLWIRDWDFDWQEQYRYASPVPLPAGTRVEMEFTYDNSAGNPRNPNSPPKRVTWGAGSGDEMAGLHIQVIPDDMADLPELGRALWGKIMRMVGGSFYRPPRKD
jgi:hypothetical protein